MGKRRVFDYREPQEKIVELGYSLLFMSQSSQAGTVDAISQGQGVWEPLRSARKTLEDWDIAYRHGKVNISLGRSRRLVLRWHTI
jgi:hypothetical protein